MSISSVTIESIFNPEISGNLNSSDNFFLENQSDSSSKSIFGSIVDQYRSSNQSEHAKSNNNKGNR